MKLKIKEFNVYIEETVFIVAILCVLFTNIRQFFSNYFICLLFISFHEFSHMLVASIFGIKTTKLSIRISGLCINLNNNNCRGLKWLAIFSAGPISNVILALIFKPIPMVYVINLVLAVINLIPIYPLDGYNILKIILEIFKVKKIELMQNIIPKIVMVFYAVLGACQLILFKNPSIAFMIIYIIIQVGNTKKYQDFGMYQKYYKNITNFNKNY